MNVNLLPSIVKEVKQSVDQNEMHQYDWYSIETLVLNCAMDICNFKNQECLVRFVKDKVLHTDVYKMTHNTWHDPTRTLYHDNIIGMQSPTIIQSK